MKLSVPNRTKHRSNAKGTDTITHPSPISPLASVKPIKKRYLVVLSALALATVPVAGLALSPARGGAPINNATLSETTRSAGTEAAPPVSPAPATADAGTGGRSTSASVQSANGKTNVTVNGQNVPVPENGSVQKTLPSDTGNVQVNVNSQSNGSAANQQSSSTSVQIYSSSTSTTEGGSNTP